MFKHANVFKFDSPRYKDVHTTHYHVAQIWRRNKCVAEARNRVTTRSKLSGSDKNTLHAEKAVIKMVGNDLRHCTLYVFRVNRHNNVLYSKPCANCSKFLMKCMTQYGLKGVVYS